MTTPAASAIGNVTAGTAPPSGISGFQWIAGFGIFSFIMVMAAESERYGEIAVAVTWLTALGATVFFWNSFDSNLANLIGVPSNPSSTLNTAQGTP